MPETPPPPPPEEKEPQNRTKEFLANDGNFMERYKKMQEKGNLDKVQKATKTTPSPPPVDVADRPKVQVNFKPPEGKKSTVPSSPAREEAPKMPQPMVPPLGAMFNPGMAMNLPGAMGCGVLGFPCMGQIGPQSPVTAMAAAAAAAAAGGNAPAAKGFWPLGRWGGTLGGATSAPLPDFSLPGLPPVTGLGALAGPLLPKAPLTAQPPTVPLLSSLPPLGGSSPMATLEATGPLGRLGGPLGGPAASPPPVGSATIANGPAFAKSSAKDPAFAKSSAKQPAVAPSTGVEPPTKDEVAKVEPGREDVGKGACKPLPKPILPRPKAKAAAGAGDEVADLPGGKDAAP